MSTDLNLKGCINEWHGSLKAYLIGFAASLLLTGASFLIVVEKFLTGPLMICAIVLLALAQAAVQLLFFLHLGQEAKPRWELLVFYFMVLVLFVIALGSLWIMNDLDDRLMSNISMEGMHD